MKPSELSVLPQTSGPPSPATTTEALLRRDNASLRQRLEDALRENEWRPIGTEPKDGTYFLAYMSPFWACAASWYCGVLCEQYPRPINPTHWKPFNHPEP